ncbi:glycerophosphodiester phosphodiesterase [Alteribacter aurantiacus]|uniref:glycerophosphodiester phosphodiesterase n=1 Tax=Alteribacter aurantiacus TaxID=254410 RepID=UPI0003FC16DE|nr:glycerophosphodiester phosphodiesterase [Alteribacter aurantiacus]
MIYFAHRGASLDAPENTLAAFQLAIENNAHGIELDVHFSKDNKIIVCHDDNIKRTTNGKGWIKDFTSEELRSFDAGSWFSSTFAGEKLPYLEEVLALCKSDTIINIEIKNVPFFHKGIEERVLQEVKRFGLEEQTVISSFDHESLLTVQELNPYIKKGLLLYNNFIDLWGYIKHSGLQVESIHPPYTFVDERFMEKSHSMGYKVMPYTVDDVKVVNQLENLNVDGLFTNNLTLIRNK